jgi:hypothetical protein
MPEDFRPAAKRPRADWTVLKGRQAQLMAVLAELEKAWGIRNWMAAAQFDYPNRVKFRAACALRSRTSY